MAYEPKYFMEWEDVQFLVDSKEYKPEIAWWLAQSSHLSYENKITVSTELRNAGFNKVTFFDTSGTQAFLATHPGVKGGKFAVLAFRGTEEDSVDILTDIKLVRRLFPNENLVEATLPEPIAQQRETKKAEKLYAHGGFVEGLQNVWGSALRKDIHSILPEAEWRGASGISEAICQLAPHTPLYFTGHSLGGALATLAAYKALVYRSNGVNIAALYTFGSPRTVQRPLADAISKEKEFEHKLFRIVNYIDLVPRLPPRIPRLLDFHHIGELVYFKKNRDLKRTLLKRDALLSDVSVLALALLEIGCYYLTFKQYTPKTLERHKITEYIKDIEQEVCKQRVAREQKGNR